MKKKTPNRPAQTGAAGALAWLCAAFMLCALPLLYHDALFDINRFKVAAVRTVVPVLCALAIAARLLGQKRAFAVRLTHTPLFMPCALLAAFALSCVLSCAARGFEHAVLYGEEGRYCGLFFTLACVAAFFVIAFWLPDGDALLAGISVCAAACALLGFANTAGIDPLGFYVRLSEQDRGIFVSTVGHVDFFGTYLAMPFALAGGQALFSQKRWMRRLCAACAALMALGAAASRTDSAVLSVALACAVLLGLSGDSLRRMAGALALCGASLLSYLAMGAAVRGNPVALEVSGLPGMLLESGVAAIAGAALLALAGLCLALARRGVRAPGRRAVLLAVALLIAAAFLLLLAGMVYFTVYDTQTDLGEAASFLRFGDEWGSRRGFVYVRALRAYAGFSPLQKLIGGGMELTQRILTPYFDNPAMLSDGVFNDAHCQPLQLLITCGLLGAASFVGFYLAMLWTLARRAGEDPVLCGALAMLGAYFAVMLINVTQPILIATYLPICALAAARLRQS